MAHNIRVLIVDDQTLIREGIRKLLELEPDLDIVGTASDGAIALHCFEQLYAQGTPPDVILMDIRMPHMDGIASTRAIKSRWPDSHIVILTTFDDVELIQAGLQAGALGYMLKDATSEQLTATVRAAARGQVLLQPDIASKAFATFAAPASMPSNTPSSASQHSPHVQQNADMAYVESLTGREREILSQVAKGASNRQIGETLFITEGTVKNHMSNILAKLGLRDRTQAALYAREQGLG